MAKYTSLRDMFDGGGAGTSGDRFQGGGLISRAANAVFNPLRGLPTDQAPEQSQRPIARPEGRQTGDLPPMDGGGSRGRNAPAGSAAPSRSARPVVRDDVAALLNDVRGAGIYDRMAPVYGGNGQEPNPPAPTPEKVYSGRGQTVPSGYQPVTAEPVVQALTIGRRRRSARTGGG